MTDRHIIIVGGGLVGALSASLLAQQGDTIHLIEKSPLSMPEKDTAFDLRVSAFSAQSKALLVQAGVWDALPEDRLCAYNGLQTWEQGSEKLTFASDEIDAELLGYIIENRWVQAVLWQQLKQLPHVHFYEQVELTQIEQNAQQVIVTLSDQQRVQGDLLLACDGANSGVRNHLHMPVTSWDYRQHCLLMNITTDCPQQSVTWQEFRETGPCAFLPLAGNNASLVWYHSPQKIKQLLALNAQQLKQTLLAEFPTLPFDFEIQNKGAFPLVRRHAQQYYQGRVVLLGDAAHTINPLAGQGVNLGFKDVACLVELLTQCSDLAIPEILKRYQRQRKPANLMMQTGMDVFYKVSKSELSMVRFLRKQFLGIAQHSGVLKKRVMRYAMGI